MQLRHLLEYLLFQCASGILGLLPLQGVRRCAAALGVLVFRLGFRRTITLENLRFAFPDLSSARLEEIAGASYRHIATTLVELLYFPHLTAEDIRSFVDFPDTDILRAISERGKGMVLLTAHFGNWELVPVAFHLLTGIAVSSLYKPQSNKFIDGKIAERRTLFGTGIIPMGLAVRDVLRALQNREAILLAADQSAPKESIWMEFFGRSIPVFQGPAIFSLKTGAALILARAVRTADGSYQMRCTEIPAKGLADTEEGMRELTRRHVAATEAMIREAPEQWMWMHRRWKHARADEEAA